MRSQVSCEHEASILGNMERMVSVAEKQPQKQSQSVKLLQLEHVPSLLADACYSVMYTCIECDHAVPT